MIKILRSLVSVFLPNGIRFKPPFYVVVYRCPVTGKRVSESNWAYSRGVCHLCGHVSSGTFTHAEKSAEDVSS